MSYNYLLIYVSIIYNLFTRYLCSYLESWTGHSKYSPVVANGQASVKDGSIGLPWKLVMDLGGAHEGALVKPHAFFW